MISFCINVIAMLSILWPAISTTITAHTSHAPISARAPKAKSTTPAVGIYTAFGIYTCPQPDWGADDTNKCIWHAVDFETYETCIPVFQKGGIKAIGPDKGIQFRIYADAKCTDLVTKGFNADDALTNPGLNVIDSGLRDKKSLPIVGRETFWVYVESDGTNFDVNTVSSAIPPGSTI